MPLACSVYLVSDSFLYSSELFTVSLGIIYSVLVSPGQVFRFQLSNVIINASKFVYK